MEIRNFLTFKTIVEQGSFVKAAKALNYAQSSVTSHIQAIEGYYGRPIFDRIGKRIVLNAFGQELYGRTMRLLEEYGAICELNTDGGGPSGKLRIAAPESTMIYRLYKVLQQYKERYPAVEIEIQNYSIQQMRIALGNGQLDLAIFLEKRLTAENLDTRELCEEKMSIVLPKDYPDDHLTIHPNHCVLYTLKGCSYREIFEGLLQDKGIQTENIIETDSVEVIKQYVLCGIGISFLPTITVQKEIAAGSLRHIPWQSDDPVLVQIVNHKDKWITPAMREFIRLTVKQAKQW